MEAGFSMRFVLAAAILLLGGISQSRAGEGEAAPSAEEPAYRECSACTLRHQNISKRLKEKQAEKEARGDCNIKGDIAADGTRRYLQPGEPHYEWTYVSEPKGERWFCSVEEAEAAGWSAAN